MIALNLTYNKNKQCKTLDIELPHALNYWSKDMLNFDFYNTKRVSPVHFVYWFSKKNFDVINFESNFIFLIKAFFSMTKNSRQKLKYLENKKSFYDEIKGIFHNFQLASICQKLPRTWEFTFKILSFMKHYKAFCIHFDIGK